MPQQLQVLMRMSKNSVKTLEIGVGKKDRGNSYGRLEQKSRKGENTCGSGPIWPWGKKQQRIEIHRILQETWPHYLQYLF